MLGPLWVHVLLYFFPLQLNVVNSVSISEDIKPLPGLPGIGNMNYPSTSPGSLVKHICAICGDRSSGACGSRCYSWGSRPVRVPEMVPVPSLTWPLVPSGRKRAFQDGPAWGPGCKFLSLDRNLGEFEVRVHF